MGKVMPSLSGSSDERHDVPLWTEPCTSINDWKEDIGDPAWGDGPERRRGSRSPARK